MTMVEVELAREPGEQTVGGPSAQATGWKRLATTVGPSGVRPHYGAFWLTAGRDNIPYWHGVYVEWWVGNPGQTTDLMASFFRTTPIKDAATAGSFAGSNMRMIHDPATDTVGIEFNLTDSGGPAYVLSYDLDNQSESTTIAYGPGNLPAGAVVVADHIVNDNVTRTSRNGVLSVGDIPTLIDDLADVDTTTVAPVQGDGLVWDGAGQWKPTAVGAGVSYMDDLLDADTVTTPPTAGNALVWDGAGNWVPGSLLAQFIGGTLTVGWHSVCQIPATQYSYGKFWLSCAHNGNQQAGTVLVEWWAGNPSLRDDGPVGSFLRTTPTKYVNTCISDVRITMDPTTNTLDIEFYSTSTWAWYLEFDPPDQDVTVRYVHGAASAANTVVIASHPVDDDITRTSRNGVLEVVSTVVAIDDLSDVDTATTAPTEGQALVWDPAALPAPGQWVPGTILAGIQQIAVLETGTGVKSVMTCPDLGQTRFGRFSMHIDRTNADGYYWADVEVEWSAASGTTNLAEGSWIHVTPTRWSTTPDFVPWTDLRFFVKSNGEAWIDINDVDATDHNILISWDPAAQAPGVVMKWVATPAGADSIFTIKVHDNVAKTYRNMVLVDEVTADDLDRYARLIRHRSMLISGGTLTFKNNAVKWSDDFVVIGVGESPELTSGHIRIGMPALGASIPGAFGHAGTTVTADGIPLADWESLYLIPPISGPATAASELRIFQYAGGSGATVAADRVPVDWVWICTRDGDTDDVWWGNGGATNHGESQTYPRPEIAVGRYHHFVVSNDVWTRLMTASLVQEIQSYGSFWVHVTREQQFGDVYWQSIRVDWSFGSHEVTNNLDALYFRTDPVYVKSGGGSGDTPISSLRFVYDAAADLIAIDGFTADDYNPQIFVSWDPADQGAGVNYNATTFPTLGTVTTEATHTVNDNRERVTRNGVTDVVPDTALLDSYARKIRHRSELEGGGTMSVTNGCAKWTRDFLFIGMGTSPEATNGYQRIAMPASGTVITGVAPQVDVTVTDDGIPMDLWDGLYFIPQASGAANAANFRMLASNSSPATPADWIRIVSRNDDDDVYWWAVGIALREGERRTGRQSGERLDLTSGTFPAWVTVATAPANGYGRFVIDARGRSSFTYMQSVVVDWLINAHTPVHRGPVYLSTKPMVGPPNVTGGGAIEDVRIIWTGSLYAIEVYVGTPYSQQHNLAVRWNPAEQADGVKMQLAFSTLTATETLASNDVSDEVDRVSRDGVIDPLPVRALDDLSDVDTTTTAPASGNLLTYDGTAWKPTAPAAGATVLAGAGLTKTGDTIDVGAFDGIIVYGDSVGLDLTYADNRYARKWWGNSNYWTFVPTGAARIFDGEDRVYYTDTTVVWSVQIQPNDLTRGAWINLHGAIPSYLLWADGWNHSWLIATQVSNTDGTPGPLVKVRIGNPGNDNLEMAWETAGPAPTTNTLIALTMSYPRFHQ